MQEALMNIPPFSRFYGIAVLGMALVCFIKLVKPLDLIFIPELIFKGQVWRLLTAPFFVGTLDINFIIYLGTSFMFIKSLEERHFKNRLSNLVFIFILDLIFIYIFSAIFYSFSVGRSVIISLEYLYSKLYQNEIVQIFFVVPIPIGYWPFVSIFFSVIQGGSILPILIGIFSSHIVFYLLFILPVEAGRPFLKCPQILVDLLDGQPFPGEVERPNNMMGRGRRIGN